MASVSPAAPLGQAAPAGHASHDSAAPHAPEHPADCDATREAVPNTGHSTSVDAALAPTALHITAPALAPTQQFCWREPFMPPGVRRALLQIYRI
jgi:hypothetical protein